MQAYLGAAQLKPPSPEDQDEEAGQPERRKGIGAVNVPDRFIYGLDLRDFNTHEPYVEEIRRIAAECRVRREEKEKSQAKPMFVELGMLPLNGKDMPVGRIDNPSHNDIPVPVGR